MEKAGPTEPSYFIRCLWIYLDEVLTKRVSEDSAACFMRATSWESFLQLCDDYGCPVITIENELVHFGRRGELVANWLHFLAGTVIVNKLLFQSLDPCILLSSPSCKHPPKGERCKNDILRIPLDSAKRACVVTRVAHIMGFRPDLGS